MAVVTFHWILDLIIVLLCGFTALYIYITQGHTYWKRRGVKTIPVSSIFGHFSDCIFARKPLRDVLEELYFLGDEEKCIGFYVFNKPFLLVREPEMIKTILVRDFNMFPNRCMSPNHSDFIGRTNIFALKSPAWKVLRQHLSPVFSSRKLKHMFHLILETGKDFDSYLESIFPDDQWKVVQVKEVCEKFSTDVIGSTLFGMKLNALNDPNAEFFNEGKKHFNNSYTRYFSLSSLFFMPQITKLLGLTFFDPDVPTFFKRAIPEAMSERVKSGARKNDLLDAFLDVKKNYEDQGNEFNYYFQEDGLVATGIVFFLAGFEPPASLAYLILYELSKKPEVQNRLRDELLTALEKTSGKITYDMVMSLPYLEMVCSEGLRKYPLLHFLDRESKEEYVFSDTNLTIEKETPIIIPMAALHMDPKYFPDPQNFDPERFSDENKRNIAPFTYFPFGEGPRNCIGMRIGIALAKVTLIQILSKYEVSPCKETPITLEFDSYTLFTKPRHNIKLHMRKIQSS